MTSIWRTGLPLLRATHTSIPSISRATATQAPSLRLYSQSSGDAAGSKQSKTTRQKEHPGPAPPNVGQNPSNADQTTSSSGEGAGSSSSNPSSETRKSPKSDSSSQEPYSATTHEAPNDPSGPQVFEFPRTPSNKAHPTVSTGQQSPNVDAEGRVSEDVPDDVKQHNAEIENRHDRSFNQLTDEGKVQKGF